MRVLAIDPGYDRIGIAVLERDTEDRESLIFSTCLETDRDQSLHHRLFHLGQEVETLLKTYLPTAIAIENLFFNKNVKTAIGVAQARGVLVYIAQVNGCPVYEFGPQEIKIAVTGYGKSDKAAVTTMVRQIVRNVPEQAFDDEFDAIAVGITCLAHYGRTS